MEVCLQVRVDDHRKWGMSLQLVGVDTTYTLGQLEARRRRVAGGDPVDQDLGSGRRAGDHDVAVAAEVGAAAGGEQQQGKPGEGARHVLDGIGRGRGST